MLVLTYCPATDEDVPVIFHQCKDLIDAYEDVKSIDYPRVLAWVENKIRENITQYTCVLHNGQKVGYYRLVKQEDGWELDDFYVLPPYRNQGIGSEVLEHCLLLANAPVFLYVFMMNTGAIRLYERFGFSAVKQVGNTRMILRREG